MSEDSGFKFGKYVEDNILYFCMNNNRFLRVVRSQLEPEDLNGDIAQQLLKAVYQFYDGSPDRVAPGKFIFDEIGYAAQRGIVNKDLESKVVICAENLNSDADKMDKDYTMGRITRFIRGRSFQRASDDFKILAGRYDVDGCEKIIIDLLKDTVGDQDLGMEFFTEESFRQRSLKHMTDSKYLMPFFIAPFDRRGFFRRKSFALIMAPEKKGKTWSGVYWGKCGILKGLNVLHVTHESGVDQWDLAERYEMAFSGSVASHGTRDKEKGEWEHETPVLYKTKGGEFKVRKKWIEGKSVEYRSEVKEGIEAAQQFGGSLIIKEYSRGFCTIRRFESYLDNLEVAKGWKPDIIINDYPDIMSLPNKEYRHAINDLYEWHSRLAGERNCLVIGFSQVKASAYKKAVITMADFAEDKRKAAHIDLAFALCQTEEEKKEGKMRLVWAVDRHFDSEGWQAVMVQDFSIGQFCKVAYSLPKLDPGKEEEE